MHSQEKVADVDRGCPEDEENLHWPADEPNLDAAGNGLDNDDLDPVEKDVDQEEEELHWAIKQESGGNDWE